MRQHDPLAALYLPRLQDTYLQILRDMDCHPTGKVFPSVSTQPNFFDLDP